MTAEEQAQTLGQRNKTLDIPRGLLKDDSGKDLADEGLLISDLVALLIGVGAASADVYLGHQSFTLNNLLACLIAVDILGVRSFLHTRNIAEACWTAACKLHATQKYLCSDAMLTALLSLAASCSTASATHQVRT